MRRRGWCASLALVTGCSDYGLDGGRAPPGAVDDGVDTDPVAELACEGLDQPVEEPASYETCHAFVVESWEPVVEAHWVAGSGPVVSLSLTVGAAPVLVAMVDPDGLVAFDATTGGEEVLGEFGNDGEVVAGARGSSDPFVAVPDSEGSHTEVGLHLSTAGLDEWIALDTPYGLVPSLAMLDGESVVLFAGQVIDADGATRLSIPTRSRSAWSVASDVDGDGMLEYVTTDGVYTAGGTLLAAWDDALGLAGQMFIQVFPVSTTTGVSALVVDGFGPLGLADDGAIVWSGVDDLDREDVLYAGGYAAVGDTNGDQDPDLCLAIDTRVMVLTSGGETLLDEPTDSWLAGWSGGCAMADLDADGNFEVVAYGSYGLRIYDVESGALLGENTEVCSSSWVDAPAVADVDSDGSAEIVVSGNNCQEGEASGSKEIFVLGPASGRWARTRPVWNQLAYDPTLIGDDGRLVAVPLRNQDTVNGLRAQPARDGDYPDLVPELVDTCADCDGDAVQLSVRIINTGSKDAEPGARIVLSSVELSGRKTELASATWDTGIAAGTAAAAKVLEVAGGTSEYTWVLDVTGAAGHECDVLNDRVEVTLPEPCGG